MKCIECLFVKPSYIPELKEVNPFSEKSITSDAESNFQVKEKPEHHCYH